MNKAKFLVVADETMDVAEDMLIKVGRFVCLVQLLIIEVFP